VYASYFGLKEPPFSITPDPRYVYLGDRHREALAHLLYGIGEGGGFVQLTGEVGTGKTTLCRTLIEQLPPDVDVALVLNPTVTAVELLATMCDELRIPYPPGTASLKVLVDALYRHLLDAHARGRRTVLVVDEAQNLSCQVLEQIRLLTNLETATTKLLQIILIGQPELIALLDRPEARPVAQRITARYHLLPLSEPETTAYIHHRIEVAGRPDLLQPTAALFSAAALKQIHRLAGGVPRLINVLCDRALLGAYATDTDRVDAAMARRAAREVLGRGPRWLRARWGIAASVAVTTAIIGGIWLNPHPGVLERLGRAALPAWSPSRETPSADVPPTPERRAAPSVTVPAAGAGVEPVTAPVAPAPPAPRLIDLLGDRALPSDRASALTALYARWHPGEAPGPTVASGCESGRLAGLDCRARTGSWTKLRRLNLPAVIELMGSDGERHYATLSRLEPDRATLEIGGKPFTFPLAEIDPLWDGAFILLWKAPPVSATLLGPGTRGKDVEWLSQRLRAIDGQPADGPRGVYDDELKGRVMAFQRSRSLLPDGIVGEETLFQLTTAVPDPSRPSLSRPGGSE
jgi:general secretion pathway protein A